MTRFIVPFILPLVLSSACGSSMQVRHEVAPESRADGYSTYAWVEHPVGQHPGVHHYAEEFLREAMLEKGFRAVERGEADLILSLHVLLGASEPGVAGPRDGSAVGAALEGAEQDSSHDKVLLAMLQDAGTHEMVWLGWARAQVGQDEVESYARQALPVIAEGLPTARRE